MLALANFHASNNSALFKLKQKLTGKSYAANAKKDVEMMVQLKYSLENYFSENSLNAFYELWN